jgi:hypothetical protein
LQYGLYVKQSERQRYILQTGFMYKNEPWGTETIATVNGWVQGRERYQIQNFGIKQT